MAELMDEPWPLPCAEAAGSPVRLPTCIPLTYRDTDGRFCLAYPRSPFNRARYLVVRCASQQQFDEGDDSQRSTDLECVHDDFGDLIPMRQRELNDDFSSSMAWRAL